MLTTINASASHGVLLYALRKIVVALDSDNGKVMNNSALCPGHASAPSLIDCLQLFLVPYPQEFLDAFFAFISFIISSATGGNMVISAGLVPILLQLPPNKRPAQLRASLDLWFPVPKSPGHSHGKSYTGHY